MHFVGYFINSVKQMLSRPTGKLMMNLYILLIVHEP